MKRHHVIALLIFIVVSLIYCFPILENISWWGQMDWDQFTFWNAVPRETILNNRQFPLWNPYVNGGNVLLAHPHSPFLSPFYVIVLIFGPVVGLKLEILIHLVIGLFGTYLLSQHFKMSKKASYLSAFVYMLNSMYALHVAEGHTSWLSMSFVPWVFLYYFESISQNRRILGAIVFLSLIFLAGSVDVLSIVILFLSVLAIVKTFQLRHMAPVAILGSLFVGTALLCAVRLIPMLEFLHQYPRVLSDSVDADYSYLYTMLLGKNQAFLSFLNWEAVHEIGLANEWHEYGAYVGVIPLLLFVIGSVYVFKKEWPLSVTGCIFLLIALGGNSPIKFWELLQNIPMYESLRVPSRFILGFILSVSILSGFGLSFLENLLLTIRNSKKIVFYQFLLSLVVLFTAYDLWSVNYPIFKNVFRIPPLKVIRDANFSQKYKYINFHEEEKYINFTGEETSHSSQYPIFLSNSGILEAYEIVAIKRGDLRIKSDPDYKGEMYLNGADQGVYVKLFSPNKIIADVEVSKPDRFVVNQNYYSGWRARIGGKMVNVEPLKGLISVPVTPGRHEITLYYMPLSFVLGLGVTVSFIMFLVIFLFKQRRYNRKLWFAMK